MITLFLIGMSKKSDAFVSKDGEKDEKFNAMVGVWKRYGLLFKDLKENYGYERALQHHIDARKPIDKEIIKSLKETYTTLSIDGYGEKLKESYTASGYASGSTVTENSVEIEMQLCPFYEGFTQAGLPHEVIKETCERTSEYQYSLFKEHYPEYMGILEFRETADDCCIEGYRLIS